jgi:hypothetical protein
MVSLYYRRAVPKQLIARGKHRTSWRGRTDSAVVIDDESRLLPPAEYLIVELSTHLVGRDQLSTIQVKREATDHLLDRWLDSRHGGRNVAEVFPSDRHATG